MPKKSSLHDKVFKLLKDKELAAQVLTVLLPPEISSLFDWQTLDVTDTAAVLGNKSLYADFIVKIALLDGEQVMFYIILEHKSYDDPDAIVQIMSYYAALCKRTKCAVVPMILLCCADPNVVIQESYLRWAWRKHDTSSPAMQKLLSWLPDFTLKVFYPSKFARPRLWRGGTPAGIVLYGLVNFWQATEDDVAQIIEKSREIKDTRHRYIIDSLIDYYENTDKKFGWQAFDRIERERWPELPEEELLMPDILLGYERVGAENFARGRVEGVVEGRVEGREEGISVGREEGISVGREEGISVGRENLILNMLKSGKLNDTMIREVTGISKKELATLKRKLKN